MPNIIDPRKSRNNESLRNINFNYDYPDGLDLRPGHPFHDALRDKLLRYATDSAHVMSGRFDSWNKIDESLTTFIETDDAEEDIKDKDHRKPVSIIYPYSYAILETILSYLLSAFFQDPIFRYEGVSPEDTIGAIMLEKVIETHCARFKVILNLHTMFRDCLSYGFGVVGPTWKKQYGRTFTRQVTPRWFGPDKIERIMRRELIAEGNALTNIDPYLCLPDPNVSIADCQKGDFFGWIDRMGYNDLLSEEQVSDHLFNVKYAKHVTGKRTSIYPSDQSARWKKKEHITVDFEGGISVPHDIIHKYVKLIPKDWKLGSYEYPEKWMFSIVSDQVIIEARPIGLGHDMFPVAVTAPDFDGYSSTPISRLETLYGLQHTLDWMFNAHVANVRKVINDTLIVDPYLINVPDLETPRAGGIIRTRRPAWGRGVKDSIMQLEVTDVTGTHVRDTALIREAMDKVAATDSWTMGSLRQGGPERLTGKEFEGTQKGAYTRLERVARIIGVQAMQDIGYMFAYHTQQFMSKELYMITTGRWEETLMMEFQGEQNRYEWNGKMGDLGRMKVSPFDLLVSYDVKVRDGSVPGSNFSGVWMSMFNLLATQPELQQKFDIVRIFKHIARNNGAKNADEFVRIKRVSDEEAASQVAAGNVVPIDQVLKGGGR